MVTQNQPQAALTPDSALEYLSRLQVPSPNSDSSFLCTKYPQFPQFERPGL